MSRVMGLDVGDVRIGVAVSDPLGIIVQPLTVVKCGGEEQDLAAIAALVSEQDVNRIVVGLPLNREGKPGPQAEKVLAFIEALKGKVSVEVVTQDERFSTAAAQRMLIDANVSRKGRKQVVDKVAAQHILRTYLDRQKNLAR